MVSRKHVCIFVVSLLWFLIPLLETWPGIHYSDAVIYAESFLANPSKPCAEVMDESFLYSCTLKTQISIFGHFGYLQLLIVILAAFCMGYSSYLLEKRYPKNHRLSWLSSALMLLFPKSTYMLAVIERDIPFTWIMILTLLVVTHLRIEKKKYLFLILGALVALLPSVKQEGFIAWPFVVLELVVWHKLIWREKLYFLSTFMTGFIAIYFLFPLLLQSNALQMRRDDVRPLHLELNYLDLFERKEMLSTEETNWLKKELRPKVLEDIQKTPWLLIRKDQILIKNLGKIDSFILKKCLLYPLECAKHRWEQTWKVFPQLYLESQFAEKRLVENQRLFGIDSLARYKFLSSYSLWNRENPQSLTGFSLFIGFGVLLLFCLIQSRELTHLISVLIYFICIVLLAPHSWPRYYYFFPTVALVFIPFLVQNFLLLLRIRIRQLFVLLTKSPQLSKKRLFILLSFYTLAAYAYLDLLIVTKISFLVVVILLTGIGLVHFINQWKLRICLKEKQDVAISLQKKCTTILKSDDIVFDILLFGMVFKFIQRALNNRTVTARTFINFNMSTVGMDILATLYVSLIFYTLPALGILVFISSVLFLAIFKKASRNCFLLSIITQFVFFISVIISFSMLNSYTASPEQAPAIYNASIFNFFIDRFNIIFGEPFAIESIFNSNPRTAVFEHYLCAIILFYICYIPRYYWRKNG